MAQIDRTSNIQELGVDAAAMAAAATGGATTLVEQGKLLPAFADLPMLAQAFSLSCCERPAILDC